MSYVSLRFGSLNLFVAWERNLQWLCYCTCYVAIIHAFYAAYHFTFWNCFSRAKYTSSWMNVLITWWYYSSARNTIVCASCEFAITDDIIDNDITYFLVEIHTIVCYSWKILTKRYKILSYAGLSYRIYKPLQSPNNK